MRRVAILTISMLALTSFMAITVRAASPHFIKGPTISFDSSTGDLCVSFKEAGLGNTPVTYSLTAVTETFTFQCFTRKGNEPQGDPNNVSFSNQSTFVTLQPRNGQITGSVCLVPEQGNAGCQGEGLVLKLIAATYTDITFKDVTNNITVSFGGTFGGPLDKPIIFP